MSGLRLALRAEPGERLDLSPLVPARLDGMDPAAIEALALAPGIRVGDVFALRMGELDDITIEGGSPLFDRVGAGLDRGTLRLEGAAGREAGLAMSGGRLELRGDAGASAAAAMTGGVVRIAGEAGDDLAGPAPDGRVGLSGGVVVVAGRAGARAGDRQRRGMVLIGGDCGEFPARRMTAGTLVVVGRAGSHPGSLMRRGTLALGPGSQPPGPTFVRTGAPSAVFLSLLGREIGAWLGASGPARGWADAGRLARYGGDLATLGKGEILVTDS